MRIILQKILFLIALPVFFGTVVYAEGNSSVQASEREKKIQDNFGNYDKMVSQQKSTVQEDTECTQTSAERVMLIEANKRYVEIIASLYAFSLIIIIILMRITDHHAKDIVTIVGLVSVIFATLLLVLMIADTQQLIAPIGIFGAIAGYLFGAAPKKEETKK